MLRIIFTLLLSVSVIQAKTLKDFYCWLNGVPMYQFGDDIVVKDPLFVCAGYYDCDGGFLCENMVKKAYAMHALGVQEKLIDEISLKNTYIAHDYSSILTTYDSQPYPGMIDAYAEMQKFSQAREYLDYYIGDLARRCDVSAMSHSDISKQAENFMYSFEEHGTTLQLVARCFALYVFTAMRLTRINFINLCAEAQRQGYGDLPESYRGDAVAAILTLAYKAALRSDEPLIVRLPDGSGTILACVLGGLCVCTASCCFCLCRLFV